MTIPNSVTSIGENAFYYCTGLTSVTIPNSVTSINRGTFACCRGLTNITIPNSVTSIGSAAFCYCRGLTSITIPNSVTLIDDFAFRGCRGLTSIDIPNSVTSIGEYEFYECTDLKNITIPNSVTSIGEYAFCNSRAHLYSAIEAPENADVNSFLLSSGNYAPVTTLTGTKSKYESLTGWMSCEISDPQIESVDAEEHMLQFNEASESVTVTVSIDLNYAEALPESFADYNTDYFLRNATKAVVEYASNGGGNDVNKRRIAGETLSVDANLRDGVLTAELHDLEDNTLYAYRIVITDSESNEVSSKWMNFIAFSGVDDVTVAKQDEGQRYNVLGQPVSENYRGVVIQNGKKSIAR